MVGTFSSTDADAGDSFTYALVAGDGSADNTLFTISGNQIRAAASFNFEAKNSCSIRVRSTDEAGLAAEKVFAITVTNVAERVSPPVASIPATFSVLEDTPAPILLTGTPFTDADSPLSTTMTVTLKVTDGSLSATTADGITVAGTALARTFTGTLAALNAYFTAAPARITYSPAANNTADRTLTATISQPTGTSKLSSSTTARIAITPVNDAPTINLPTSFKVTEDVKGNLSWSAISTPFTDVDAPTLTVTLAVQDGVISAAGTTAVTVAGTDTVKTFAGTTAALNSYFRSLGKIAYTTARDNTVARTLTATVSDGSLTASKTSTITITPVNDAPSINSLATLAGAIAATPFEITYDAIRAAANPLDAENATPSFMITKVDSGKLERWNGTAWVAAATASSSPTATSLLAPGQKLRWTPPAGVSGDRLAFKVKAWDGSLASSAVAQVSVRIG
jgi:hypothetical protein